MKQEIKITQNSNADMSIGVPKNLTAIEWFLQQIDNKNGKEFSSYYQEFVEQAKAMEKEQIVKAVTFGNRQDCYDATETLGEQYYNEKYSKQEIEKL